MNRSQYEMLLLRGARVLFQIINEKHINFDGIMMSIDDKPIYYTELMEMARVRINEIMDMEVINEISNTI